MFIGGLPTWGARAVSAEAAQFFARITTPTGPRQVQYATMIDALVAAGVWAKLDALYIFAGAAEATALTNLIQSTYAATKTSTPTFTADHGFTGSTGKYLSSNFNPTTAVAPNFVQNSATIFFYNYTSGANGHFMGNASAKILLTPNVSNTTVYYNVNQNSNNGVNTITAGGVGFYLATRRGALGADVHLFVNGTQLDVGAFVSSAPANETITMLSGAGVEWAGDIGCAGIGSKLTDAEQLALYNAIHTYLQAVAGVA